VPFNVTETKMFLICFQAQEKLGAADEAIKSYKLALKNNSDNPKVYFTSFFVLLTILLKICSY